jgi:lysophospholipase L1-like esterase
MNINPKAIRIVCYGDSNTWGYIPGSGERYDPTIRWTGRLQQALGDGFEIIEEGLNSGTTIIDDPNYESKNGAAYLKSCLQSHYSLDIVILMLGVK